MSKAAGVKKPNESQKARAIWRMKAARDSGEDFFVTQSARTTFWEEMKRDWNCGKSTSKTQLWHWTTFDVWLRILVKDDFWLETSTHWNVPKKSGSHGELFFFLLKKEPMVLSWSNLGPAPQPKQ